MPANGLADRLSIMRIDPAGRPMSDSESPGRRRGTPRRAARRIAALAARDRPHRARAARAGGRRRPLAVRDARRRSRWRSPIPTCPRSAASPTTGRSCRCASISADGVLLGEFGEERRNFTPIAQIPKVMKDAVLAIEDARFYQHSGVDYVGVAARRPRQLRRRSQQPGRIDDHDAGRAQFLSVDRENIHAQDLRDAARAEDRNACSRKDQILEIYMNQISSASAPTASRRPARSISASR